MARALQPFMHWGWAWRGQEALNTAANANAGSPPAPVVLVPATPAWRAPSSTPERFSSEALPSRATSVPEAGSVIVVEEVVPAPAAGDVLGSPIVVDDTPVSTRFFLLLALPLTLLN